MARQARQNSREKHNRDSVKQEKRQDRDGTRHTYLLIVLLPVNINKCVRDAPNNDVNGQTGTSANNSFGFNTTQHNTTKLKKSRELGKTVVEGNWGGAYEFTHNMIGTTWKKNKAIDQLILVLKYKRPTL